MSRLSVQKAPHFDTPTARPHTAEEQQAWHEANRAWWESNPMRYDWNEPLAAQSGAREWYGEMDRRFFSAGVIPHRRLPFDSLIPFDGLPRMDVLEIGVGMGAHAQLLSSRARSYTGIDLTSAAVAATQRRLELFGIEARILRMNAENLAFPDASFDLVWTWGVIHHTSDTRTALAEIRRVLRPTGRALVMVYHRAFVPWYVYGGMVRGVLLGGLLKHKTIHGVVQSATDGALARYYSKAEWRREVQGLFDVERFDVFGNRAEALPLPAGKMKESLLRAMPESVLRGWLTGCRQGTMLFSSLKPLW